MEKETKQPKDLYKLFFPFVSLALDYKYTRNIVGAENILDEPAIYAANHIHAVDSLLLSETYTEETGKPIRFAVKKGYFDGTGVDDKGKLGRTARFAMKHTLQVPVSREGNDRQSYQLFEDSVRQTLNRGDSFAIHPEGTRSNDGRLHKFKSGVARLAIANHVPIVPVGLVYDTHTNSRKVDVEISFGQPFFPDELKRLPYTALPGLKYKADHVTQVIENRVARQTGMNQSGAFAALRKLRQSNN
jgi:1-acyl-sn-glycerol-3-phosphate acyltransferase